MGTLVGVRIAFGNSSQTDRRTKTDAEMFSVIERLIHIPVRRESGTEFGFVAQIQIADAHTDGRIVPLLQTMPSARRKKLHGKTTA